MVLLLVKDGKRVRKEYREGPELGGFKKGYWVLILQLKTQNVKLIKRILYRIYIRELNRVPNIECQPYN